jgi:hypothetical protein
MATIEARITKVEHDVGTGWFTIATDHGTVKKLTTKMEQKAREAAALRTAGDVALIEYSPKQRHDESTGRTYNNNYYERAKKADTHSANGSGGIDTVGGSPGIEQTSGRKTDPAEAWRIALSVGAKLAVDTLPMMPVEQRDFETQKRIALAWAIWIYQTPPEQSRADAFASAPSAGGPGAYSEPDGSGWDAPPPHDDMDIPF